MPLPIHTAIDQAVFWLETQERPQEMIFAMATLDPRDQQILHLRHTEIRSFTEIGLKMNLSASRVRQINNLAMVRLYRYFL